MAIKQPDPWNRNLEKALLDILESLRFGTVTLLLQNGRVIQMDKTEKIRFNRVLNIDGSGI